MHRFNSSLPCVAWLFIGLVFLSESHAAPGGSVRGTASNAATGNLLRGVRIEVAGEAVSALTDSTGQYELSGLAAGQHELIASYVGLDPQKVTVVISADAPARRDFNLTSAIYTMQEFRVAGEREGSAAAITAQRNADNVKNVLAMDSFGTLSNQSASEMVIRLPAAPAHPRRSRR